MNEATGNQIPVTQAPAADGAVPTAPAGYDLLHEIGRGGMGVVYRARDRALDREVAVKILQDKYAPDSGTARRFVDEARITGQLQHPAIPAVYQVGTLADGRPFLAMKLIKGQTLDELLKVNAAVDALAVFEAICQAVGYAHAHGVIHRDLKPGNVMVGSFGEVQVMDWGLAKVLSASREREQPATDPDATTAATEIRTERNSDTPFTQYGSVLGTPAYMAPEQAAGELDKIDARSDVFGLGAILCVLLTGQPPFDGKDADTVRLNAVRGKTEAALARLEACQADPEVVALCKRCLLFEPAERPATGDAVATAVAGLRQAADQRARQAERDRMAAEVQAAEQAKRRRLTMWAAGAVAAMLLLGIAGTTWGLLRANDARELAERREKEAETERDEKEKARIAEEAAKTAAIDAQNVAEQKRTEAEHSREVTTQQRRLALDTVRGVLLRVDDLMKNDTRLAPLRIEIIRRMLDDVDRIRDHALKNPLEDRTEALAYSRLGEVYFRANRIEDAALWYGKAYTVLEKQAKDAPEDPNALRNLAAAGTQLADAQWRLGNGNRCRELQAQALALRRKRRELLRNAGGSTAEIDLASADFDIADSLQRLAYVDLLRGDSVSAIDNYTASDRAFAALPPPLPDFLNTRRTRNEIQVRLADAKSKLGRLDEAEKHFRDALANRESLLKSVPGSSTPPMSALVRQLKTDVGQSRMYLGDFLLMFRKDRVAAAAEYAAGLDVFSLLLKAEPDSLDLRERLGATYYRLGLAAIDPDKAREAYVESLKIREELAKIDPKDMQSGVQVALSLARAGKHADAERMAETLLKQAGKDRQVLFQVACTLSILSGTSADRETADRCRDHAFQVLRDLATAGWKERRALETDPDFDAIRQDPRFEELLKALPNPAEASPPPRPAQ
jgi:tRNA A-37 threonylcarbamoyl transferase component Bud32/tetratricopeptide (TPR) repeat protein